MGICHDALLPTVAGGDTHAAQVCRAIARKLAPATHASASGVYHHQLFQPRAYEWSIHIWASIH